MYRKRTTADVVAEFKEKYGDQYDYSLFEYSGFHSPGIVICPEHGEFEVAPHDHRRGRKCPACAETFKAKCKRLGVDYYRALKRRQAGMPDERIFSPDYVRNDREVGPISVFGKDYPNLKVAIRALNPPAPRETIGRWIKGGMPPEEAFTRIPNPGVAKGIIYLVTNKRTGKQYVGLTVMTLERRWQYHLEQASAERITSEASLHAAIREFGPDAFTITKLDTGKTKDDLEKKERRWIKKKKTLVPAGYNITLGGESGGANKVPTEVDGILFPSVREAAVYVAESRNITYEAAAKRLSVGRVNIRKPSPPGKAVTKTQAYKSWSRIVHGAMNPNSKQYNPDVELEDDWRDFFSFLDEVGQPPEPGMCFARINMDDGYFRNNCRWMTRSECCQINAAHMKKKGTLVGRRGKKPKTR